MCRPALQLASTLKVGGTIEEIDIRDLKVLPTQTEKPDTQLLYKNLMKDSQMVTRAFTSTLEKRLG